MKQRVLVIQPAFIGDAILTTGLVETLCDGGYEVDLLIRAGNESLFAEHPRLGRLLIWEKRERKYRNWWILLRRIRAERYDLVVNTHRFLTSGLWTALSGAPLRFGFRQNPLWYACTYVAEHTIGDGSLEVERNLRLIAPLGLAPRLAPKLYPRASDYACAQALAKPFVTIAPASVWFTKRYPAARWAELIAKIPAHVGVHLLGSAADAELCGTIARGSGRECTNQAGRLPLLSSAAVMAQAQMNYVNDSSPLHLASAMNAPVTAFFLSTAPILGFGPLSDERFLREPVRALSCRPCGPTGKRACPLGHFKCSEILAEP